MAGEPLARDLWIFVCICILLNTQHSTCFYLPGVEPEDFQKGHSILLFSFKMIPDNLPLVIPIRRPDQESSMVYLHGFLVGLKGQYSVNKEVQYFIHNHLTFVVKYHKDPVTEVSRIVGFEVKPFRYNWFLCMLLVHKADLFVSQK